MLVESKKAALGKQIKEPIQHLQVRAPLSLHERLRKMNFETRVSMQAFTVEAIDRALKEKGY